MRAPVPVGLPAVPHDRLVRALTVTLIAMVAAATAIVVVDRGWERESGRDWGAGSLSTVPAVRAAVGSIVLDGSMADVIDHLGAPDALGPDIEGVSHQWMLAGGALLSVTTPLGSSEPIVGIVATIPSGSTVRIGLYGDILLGDASVADVVEAWGEPEARGGPLDDFDVRYVECRGPYPIVLKVDMTPAFDRVLVGYADEPPGSNGCDAV